jgi:hypothetical protein
MEETRHFGPEEERQLAEVTGINTFSMSFCRFSFLSDFDVHVLHVQKF